jgi:uncharacterized protein YbjT (DUF2867 family)
MPVAVLKRLALVTIGAAFAALISACAAGGASHQHAQAEKPRTILVAGGSGRSGTYVVRRLKDERATVRATTRSVAEARKRLGPDAAGVDWVETDVRDASQVEQAMQGVDQVICVIGSRELSGPNSAEFVDYRGVKNLVDAAVKHKVKHFTLLTAIGSTDKESLANRMFKGALEWRFKGEEYLRASGLTYTVVRPAGLTNEPAGTKGVKLWQGDDWKSHLRKTISRDDLALVLIETLRNPGARNATFEITNEASEPVGRWAEQMVALKADGP